MKLIRILPALVALVGFAFVPLHLSAQSSDTPASGSSTDSGAPAKPKGKKGTPFSGAITAVDASANTVTVDNNGTPVTLTVNEKTKIKKAGAAATIADLAVGQKVTGSYSEKGGAATAKMINVTQ